MTKKILSLQELYSTEVAPNLKKELGIKNVNAIPKVKSIKVNVGLSQYIAGKKDYSDVINNLAIITGQKPVVTKARKAISNFKIRENMPVGVAVTLRGNKMYDFLNKLINITFPRVRDFRGLSAKQFDGNGNYSVGIKENNVFPEINPDSLDKLHGLQVTIITTATNDENGYKLLKAMGFPFKKENN